MTSDQSTYSEALLHWIWKTSRINYSNLLTAQGKALTIYDPGLHNHSDGPDFTGAEIGIGPLRWYGDIEIHWSISDWKNHGHHTDPNFENVILHIVFEETDQTIQRKDGSSIPTLCLAPLLSKPLQIFANRYRQAIELPCSGQLSFISEEVFRQQLEKAHKEYFDQKVNDFLKFYDPNLPPSEAWLKTLAISLFDGLGISHNRRPMQKLAQHLWLQLPHISSRNTLRVEALKCSGINQESNLSCPGLKWNHKGCRPGNHPRPRIQQGAQLLWHISTLPFEQWLKTSPDRLWKNLRNDIDISPGLGKERSSILFGTVFLPAIYSLGNLFYSEKCKHQSWNLWLNHDALIPKSLFKKFETTDISPTIYNQKLGSIYQLKAYCQPRNCQQCKVFKSVISS